MAEQRPTPIQHAEELAKLFGYVDDKSSLGVEKLMKQYYRAVANLRELNDALLQHLDEAIVQAGARAKIIPLNKRFQINNGYIEVTEPQIFERFLALLEIFFLMAQDPKIEGIRASTIRLLRENRRLIDNDFRHDLRNLTLFMELLRSPYHMRFICAAWPVRHSRALSARIRPDNRADAA